MPPATTTRVETTVYVYLLYYPDYDGDHVSGVFSSPGAAKKYHRDQEKQINNRVTTWTRSRDSVSWTCTQTYYVIDRTPLDPNFVKEPN